jgi:hypothetical protein
MIRSGDGQGLRSKRATVECRLMGIQAHGQSVLLPFVVRSAIVLAFENA